MPEVGAHPFLDHPGPLAFAHQGGNRERPENSIAAFSHAVDDLGFRYLETDVRLTRDGRVVVIHDAHVDRVTDGQGAVADLDYAELGQLRLWAPDGQLSEEPVPLLDELLVRWPDVRWNIDAKEDRVAHPLASLVARLGMVDRVCLGAFAGRRVAVLRRRLGAGLCTVCGPLDVARLLARGYGVPVGRPRGGCAQVPVRRYGITIVTERFVGAAHRAGLAVVVWTVDDEAEMHRLLDLGVDGLMTDRPSLLRAVLEARGAWHGR
ncbi:MAG: glycerophosphodiester phosphodiesterase [Acidimicrobiia bacterium]|nr:glycerophosphodiester phosphodiesterase [Acidimicrobiia bacterium]